VIEPLRALISSQLKELKAKDFSAENLLSKEDALIYRRYDAKRRMHLLFNHLTASGEKSADRMVPRILFCTPEIFSSIKEEVKLFVLHRLISLIVVDEYDFLQEANENYREAYLQLMPDIRIVAPNVQVFFLSATFSRKLISQIVLSSYQSVGKDLCKNPRLYQAEHAIPLNHVFSGT
jgi:superfamily II DNA helicase RecQ